MTRVVQVDGETMYLSETDPSKASKSNALFDQYPDLLTPQHIAEITGQCQATIRSLCISNALPAVRIGRRWYVPKQDLIEYVRGGRRAI